MANLFSELFHQMDDRSRLNAAKTLAASGKMTKARRSLIEVLTDREERFGEKSLESLEVLLWLADLHLAQATAHLELALLLLGQICSPGTVCQYSQNVFYLGNYRLIEQAIEKELQRSYSVLKYAEREIEKSARKGELEIRLQIALLQIADCFTLIPGCTKDTSDSYSFAQLRQLRFSKALARAESLATQTPGYRELNTFDYLVEVVNLYGSQSADYVFICKAARLQANADEQRALLIEYEAAMTLYGRPA